MLCEQIADGASAPSDAIVTWKDGKGVDYCVRPQVTRLPVPEYNPANGPVIPWNHSSALFEIGHDVLIKVKWGHHFSQGDGDPWDTEGLAMRLVRERAPSVPVPEAIHYWFDKEWDRYFLITRRIHGVSVDSAWFKLHPEDHLQLVKELAAHTKAIAGIKAPLFQRLNGENQEESVLVGSNIQDQICTAQPGPYTAEEFREHLRKASDGLEPPEFGPEFHLYHNDMGPTNVMISGTDEPHTEGKSHVHIAGIFDWERAGFYPKFWITLVPILPGGGYCLGLTEEQMEEDMSLCSGYVLGMDAALQEVGFQSGFDFGTWWSNHYAAMKKVDERLAQEAKEAKEAKEAEGSGLP